jgi:hypothetical protein
MLFILAATLGIVLLDLKDFKKHHFKNLLIYFLILFISLSVNILLLLEIRPVSPAEIIGGILRGAHLIK